jgi:hypothetical protein
MTAQEKIASTAPCGLDCFNGRFVVGDEPEKK